MNKNIKTIEYGASNELKKISDKINRNIAGKTIEEISGNILDSLRNLVEATMFISYEKDINEALYYEYNNIQNAIKHCKKLSKYRKFVIFHEQLQVSTSHYTVDVDNSERLLIKYIIYLYEIREYLKDTFGLELLEKLEEIKFYDKDREEYYTKILELVNKVTNSDNNSVVINRYYVEKQIPVIIKGEIFHELTLSTATDKRSKFDRIIVFSKFKIRDNYSIKADVINMELNIFDDVMLPIKIIRSWKISIRTCELQNYSKLLYRDNKSIGESKEYKNLMKYMTANDTNLLELVLLDSNDFDLVKKTIITNARVSNTIITMLEKSRSIINNKSRGANILRYFLYNMKNVEMKNQFAPNANNRLSGLFISNGSIPFEDMPICSSLIGHNPKFSHIIQSIDLKAREHEFLARKINANTTENSKIYSDIKTFENKDDINKLIEKHNKLVFPTHKGRYIRERKNNLYITSYEENTIKIMRKIKSLHGQKNIGYKKYVAQELKDKINIDDPKKEEILLSMFEDSSVAAIYGAAGTGKTYILDKFSQIFSDVPKLFLTNTNTALNNLKNTIKDKNSYFNTVHGNSYDYRSVEILIIDEATTISNEDMVKLLNNNKYKWLVVVGDIYQIEAIKYGNWFNLLPNIIKDQCFELETPFRTKDKGIINLWKSVRTLDGKIEENLGRNGYSKRIDNSIFTKNIDDEIILCFNYDGLYGINNLNLLLQLNNPNPKYEWKLSTYKVEDPIVFNETDRFPGIIHNNMKGIIKRIEVKEEEMITFDIFIDTQVNPLNRNEELEIVSTDDNGTVIRFSVMYDKDTNRDGTLISTIVPFQVSYAVSIHRSQGLEYESVKLVISDEYEERISHNIFYTAITRTKKNLTVYWSPSTQKNVIESFEIVDIKRDYNIIKDLI